MRVTGGRYRGRTLAAPRGDATRPTTDRTREALFNLLGARLDFDGLRVLDAFAGSGALGLEALSRGAARATFVERGAPALAVIRQNVQALSVVGQTQVIRGDALRWLEQAAEAGERFDLAFADPPYALAEMAGMPDRLLAVTVPGGWVALEHGRDTDFESHPALVTARRYGQTVVSMFHRDA